LFVLELGFVFLTYFDRCVWCAIAIDCLGRLVSEITYYISSVALNSAYSVILSECRLPVNLTIKKAEVLKHLNYRVGQNTHS